MKYTRLTFIAIAAVGLMTACGPKDSKQEQQAAAPQQVTPLVSVVSVAAEDIDITTTYTSNVEPNVTNNIVSQSAGRINNIYVEVGNKVSKGQLLATMDDANLAKSRLHHTARLSARPQAQTFRHSRRSPLLPFFAVCQRS